MIRRFRFKHLIRFMLIAIAVWLTVMAALALGVYTFGDTENAETADAIVILGSGLRRDGRPGDALYRRSVWGAGLYRQGYAPVVICTGGIGRNQTRSEASACREVLIGEGVPTEAIYLDEQSASTEENAIYAQQIMLDNGWDSAVLVTDSFHMLRANWIFDSYFDDNGITHTRHPVPRDWVLTRFYVRHFSREIIALQWQAFKEFLNLPVTSVPGG